jgi:hypothetical protein
MKKILIGGADRSGTTMLGSLLGSIPNSIVTPESLFKTEVTFELFNSGEYRQKLNKNWRFKTWNVEDDFWLGEKLESFNCFYESLVEYYSKGKKSLYWIDHSPNNLQHARFLERNLKNVYFVHIVRDGRAVANSQIPLEWGANTCITHSRDWLKKVTLGLAAQAIFPEKTIMVKYEDVILKPVETLNNIFKFTKSDFQISSINQLVPQTKFLPSYSKKQHKLVSEKPNSKQIESWKTSLSYKEVSEYQFYAGELLGMLDYTLLESPNSKPSIFRFAHQYYDEWYRRKITNPKIFRVNRGLPP